MQVNQIYDIMNQVTGEALGETAVLQEDLSNIVDYGDTIQNVMGVDNFVKKLCDVIGRVVFVDRLYEGRIGRDTIMRDAWEYGAILEKISTTSLPVAQENQSWSLNNGESYDPNVFYQTEVTVKFYNDRVTFEIPLSITEMQVKSAFKSATQLNSFISMLKNSVQNSYTVKMEELVRRALNNLMSEVIYANDGVTYVKLLTLYNATVDTPITADEFMRTPAAMKFAINKFYTIIDRMSTMSTLYNLGHQPRFTPESRLSVIMLSDFKSAAQVYLDSDTFHKEMVALPKAETTVFWQGSGTDYGFEDVSNINVSNSYGHSVNVSNIVAVLFDREAVGVANQETHVTNNWNPVAEFWNEWLKSTVGLFNDANENMVVFALN